MNKFKVGDKVENHIGVIFRVLQVLPKGPNGFDYVVEHWNKTASSGKLTIGEEYISFSYDSMHKKKTMNNNPGDVCPVCQTPWTKSSFGMKQWKDCVPCGKTAEDIVAKDNSKIENNDKKSVDWDEDDFGHYYGDYYGQLSML